MTDNLFHTGGSRKLENACNSAGSLADFAVFYWQLSKEDRSLKVLRRCLVSSAACQGKTNVLQQQRHFSNVGLKNVEF